MKIRFFVLFLAIVSFQSCEEESYIPKPKGFFRLDFPEHSYSKFDVESCPFTFEYGSLAQVIPVEAKNDRSVGLI